MHKTINELKGQLSQLDINSTVDFQDLQKVISEQKNV